MSKCKDYVNRHLSGERLAFEFKASLSPHLTRGFPGTLETLQPEKTWVVCPMIDPDCNMPLTTG
jgi:hypothetical protein